MRIDKASLKHELSRELYNEVNKCIKSQNPFKLEHIYNLVYQYCTLPASLNNICKDSVEPRVYLILKQIENNSSCVYIDTNIFIEHEYSDTLQYFDKSYFRDSVYTLKRNIWNNREYFIKYFEAKILSKEAFINRYRYIICSVIYNIMNQILPNYEITSSDKKRLKELYDEYFIKDRLDRFFELAAFNILQKGNPLCMYNI